MNKRILMSLLVFFATLNADKIPSYGELSSDISEYAERAESGKNLLVAERVDSSKDLLVEERADSVKPDVIVEETEELTKMQRARNIAVDGCFVVGVTAFDVGCEVVNAFLPFKGLFTGIVNTSLKKAGFPNVETTTKVIEGFVPKSDYIKDQVDKVRSNRSIVTKAALKSLKWGIRFVALMSMPISDLPFQGVVNAVAQVCVA